MQTRLKPPVSSTLHWDSLQASSQQSPFAVSANTHVLPLLLLFEQGAPGAIMQVYECKNKLMNWEVYKSNGNFRRHSCRKAAQPIEHWGQGPRHPPGPHSGTQTPARSASYHPPAGSPSLLCQGRAAACSLCSGQSGGPGRDPEGLDCTLHSAAADCRCAANRCAVSECTLAQTAFVIRPSFFLGISF